MSNMQPNRRPDPDNEHSNRINRRLPCLLPILLCDFRSSTSHFLASVMWLHFATRCGAAAAFIRSSTFTSADDRTVHSLIFDAYNEEREEGLCHTMRVLYVLLPFTPPRLLTLLLSPSDLSPCPTCNLTADRTPTSNALIVSTDAFLLPLCLLPISSGCDFASSLRDLYFTPSSSPSPSISFGV
jgi:hypothetical protein